MNDYATDDEQVEALKRWWEANGLFVVSGIVLGIAALIGWNWYGAAQQRAAEEASGLYQTLLESVAEGKEDAAVAAHTALQQEHAGSAYAAHAWLAAARLHMDSGDTEAAIAALTRMLDTDVHADLKNVARQRLAQAYLYLERFDDAYEVLQPVSSGYQSARVDELLGDIERARGNERAARLAYEAALAAPADRSNIDAGYVRLKLAQLPPQAAPADATDEVADDAANDGEPDAQ